MSSGEDRTHHWLLTSPGPGEGIVEDDPMAQEPSSGDQLQASGDALDDPLAPSSSDAPDEGIVSSPVNSLDLDRDSPMGGGLDDEEDGGPPSIETQPPDHVDDLEVSGITSTWISTGGSHYGNSHPGLGYSILNSDLPDTADSTGLGEMPGLEPGDFGVGPVYGPQLPGPFNSPVHESSSITYGDVADENAVGGICGLRNLGNTCFMAAGIQCLVNTPPIAQYFFRHHHDNLNTKDSLAGQFSQLTNKIWCGKYSSLRPADFKDAFGQQWRDFRDYRQHDCQEFVTLLLEALRKQMCVTDDGGGGTENEDEEKSDAKGQLANIDNSGMASSSSSSSSSNSRSSSSSTSSSNRPSGSRGSHSYSSPSSPQSPHCPTSPQSPHCPTSPPSLHSLKQPLELRSDPQEEAVGLDSGAASPKSSVSSSSVDAHLVNLRLQPIPEEVRALIPSRMNASCDDLSLAGTTSCHDAESVASDMSDPAEVSGSSNVRRYNQLGVTDVCDSSDCDSSTAHNLVPAHRLQTLHCDSSSTLEKNQLNDSQGMEKNQCSEASRLEENERNNLGSPPESHLSLVKLEDIMKETKTSNVNVLVKDNPANNELLFDSEKYAKYDKSRLKNSLDNLNKSGVKRVKEVNLLHDKRGYQPMDVEGEYDDLEDRQELAINKRMRLDEKNIQYELERYQVSSVEQSVDSSASTSGVDTQVAPAPSISSHEQRQADLTWRSFVGDAKSAVVDTFYGQFKSSLVCSVCGHTSVKYDPFGTLSVPLPYANQIQISVTYEPYEGSVPTRYLITLCKVSYVSDLKAALCKVVGLNTAENLVTAEVFDNHIARIVEDSYMTKFLNYNLRSIYGFLLAPPPPSADEEEEMQSVEDPKAEEKGEAEKEPESQGCSSGGTGTNGSSGGGSGGGSGSGSNLWRPCNICLEEMCQTELRTHHTCEDCLLCDGCIEMSCKHHGGESLPCPVCQTSLSPSDLIPVEKRKMEKPKARLLRVPLVFRMDQESDNNNKRCMQLMGHPSLLALPSRLRPATLTRTLAPRIPAGTQYSLLFVDGRGYNCSRCLFSSHCRGCEVLDGPEVVLQAGDTLCVRFTSLTPEQCHALAATTDHPSLNDMRQNDPLTLYDCLRAFTQSETLEETDSWFCPKCERKQQATKTISVWRYPPYLIIHLERFLFHGTMSTKLDDKVIFPLDGLDVSDFVSRETSTSQLYNLYACVCHVGVAQAGHYTAFARSPVTGEWHYFNDDSVTRQKPREEEYSTAYLLFYHRQGTKFDLSLPKKFAFVDNGAPKNVADCDDQEAACSSGTNNKIEVDMYDPQCN
ncbi:uncharacterized protein LOC122246550 [Penaeus japonicus]|uniref:uncharacterized protein LOC122246550 n=1 Tax=Penaeus japonicus TaxID=27405 RepID=UPI001C714B2A|nr:uncharacterized protein LOC122246550 [Penaeus japonicus]